MRQQREKLRIAEEQRLEVEREKREKERRLQEMKEIQKQQVWDRVESLRGTDVGKRAFKNLSAKVQLRFHVKVLRNIFSVKSLSSISGLLGLVILFLRNFTRVSYFL